ncbi:hypothetical protein [Thermoanaerobacterium thermosaccharolyticum]|uniref:hypothetical protein n=1 Tax=Thermoanaerobacterium thermosaccharolyticum TaxID=1517 RepID=UPI0001B0EBDD|nr:hypothetical protein [Thermoanaerobacterium thermosaccharolyticum]
MNKQISFFNFIDNFNQLVKTGKPRLLDLFDQFTDIDELIPLSWLNHYYKDTGRPHANSLYFIVSCLLFQILLYIPTVELLITFLNFSEESRNFCCLNSVPDAFFFTTLKQDYAHDIESFFHKLVDITEPICQELGESMPEKLDVDPSKLYIIDTIGIKCFVKENNPKFFNTLIKRLNILTKINPKRTFIK